MALQQKTTEPRPLEVALAATFGRARVPLMVAHWWLRSRQYDRNDLASMHRLHWRLTPTPTCQQLADDIRIQRSMK